MFKSIVHLFAGAAAAAVLFTASPAFAAPQLEGQININTATQEQLELLPGVGPAMAKKIVDYRAAKPFSEPLQIVRIKGIGRKTFDRMKTMLTVKGETTLREVGKDELDAKAK
ncbi:MAG: helix-hairpin-helix domain-containing protein [Myxococcales bacterium]|nr:helix-hairpin-helix domain-containing protein [Myxococcales bacterium]